ncbi:ankyrin repeat protein (macronuclear) [Tetrahymena thermophila SB210]|uniref:Ankyrin repeat protein n=1 Tax=Tetrahymena thermophila (strain SB210) TaxID=312017 RepID=I7ML14_TETTS|nr:ankyrin repeat protein [Tetrahymena thermophila SB210]EAS00861.2 ankyrin repeat protein [Tetrahymena thermophila SB210]|eukprot:XP_001021106.2 ankyrin repeat protein [Tetrahymena thermophila SB210]
MDYKKSGTQNIIERPNHLLETKPNKLKKQLLNAVCNDNLDEVKQLVEVEKILPNEELSIYGYFWNSIHYAAHYGKSNILEYLIQQLYKEYKEDLTKEILNYQTKEGWTALMISCIYDSVLCIKMLIKLGGINLIQKDIMGRTALDLCKSYGQVDCFELIHEAREIYGDEIPLNKNYLEEDINSLFQSLQISNKEYHYLCLNGISRDCIICNTNKGYLKYTQCCSHPIHLVCFIEQPKKVCLNCDKFNYNITRELREPELAFFIPDQQLNLNELDGLKL